MTEEKINEMQELVSLLKKRDELIDKQVDLIIKEMVVRHELTHTFSTCDYRNWDRELHRMMPQIAKKLREKGLNVSSSVNYGVTDWVVTV